ncbi:hypothetical protein ACFLX2_01130 [Candidatus Dependentiae bacterium]
MKLLRLFFVPFLLWSGAWAQWREISYRSPSGFTTTPEEVPRTVILFSGGGWAVASNKKGNSYLCRLNQNKKVWKKVAPLPKEVNSFLEISAFQQTFLGLGMSASIREDGDKAFEDFRRQRDAYLQKLIAEGKVDSRVTDLNKKMWYNPLIRRRMTAAGARAIAEAAAAFEKLMGPHFGSLAKMKKKLEQELKEMGNRRYVWKFHNGVWNKLSPRFGGRDAVDKIYALGDSGSFLLRFEGEKEFLQEFDGSTLKAPIELPDEDVVKVAVGQDGVAYILAMEYLENGGFQYKLFKVESVSLEPIHINIEKAYEVEDFASSGDGHFWFLMRKRDSYILAQWDGKTFNFVPWTREKETPLKILFSEKNSVTLEVEKESDMERKIVVWESTENR